MALHPQLAALKRSPRVILLGSGGLSIGQAGEFDYSGSQAVKALKEEGVHVIIVNPNIATVQTNPEKGVTVYLYPVDPYWVTKIIEKDRPDAIIAGFGGQTALNCLIALDDLGVLKKYDVLNLGTPVSVLKMSEDRDEFAKKMIEIGMPVPPSQACTTVSESLAAAHKIGYPVILRAAYALGGLGSGFASNDHELTELAQSALTTSPQVLIEKSLRGWKEIEYEVMRDREGNAITICNMENFDPLGIHTGDSIVVCPSQSLSDDDYQLLRNASLGIINALGVVGECNVQLTLDPKSLQFYVIEVNARLSRSSALASKASGYPIAYIAAKVVLGYDLLQLKNPVTGCTSALFEPAMDYITIKMPRWDLQKFRGVSSQLGSTMKSVGEVMAIGRNFLEVLQKGVRMVTEDPLGIHSATVASQSNAEMLYELEHPTDSRIYAVISALRQGMDIEELYRITAIDKWFLAQVRDLVFVEKQIEESASTFANRELDWLKSIDHRTFHIWKNAGFSDDQISYLFFNSTKKLSDNAAIASLTTQVRRARLSIGIKPVVKRIDTTAAEHTALTNYFYLTYGGTFNDHVPDDGKQFSAIILGGGSYRIGTSVEFDWAAVSCSQRLRGAGWRSVVINCNPETVSTDFNTSDRLYFEELSLERVQDIIEIERCVGVIASMGGQVPNKLAKSLTTAGIKLLGHSYTTVDMAEDRNKFSALLDQLEIDQPRWRSAKTREEVDIFVRDVGFPVLIRPSYVLSGAAMSVAYNRESLDLCLTAAALLSPEHPVVISEFITDAREIELDGVAKNGEILTSIVSEHIENAGVHSGDATMVVPAQRLYVETVRRVRRAGSKIAKGLKLNGPFNMQFLAKAGDIKVIECNARAARSFPFVSKVVGLNLANLATDVMIGKEIKIARLNEDNLPFVGVKAAMFSFSRLKGADPILGVEMASTGEVGCIGSNFDEALILAMIATHIRIPKKGVLVSSGNEKNKIKFLSSAKILQQLNIPLYATEGTADYLQAHGFPVTKLHWPNEGPRDVVEAIRSGVIDLVINIPKSTQRDELTRGGKIRRAATRFGCPLLTNMEIVIAFIEAIQRTKDFVANPEIRALPEYQ